MLIRRVTFGLTGMPPTPGETRAFLRDRSPFAYEKLVDRLLSSRAYGEHWARKWLDVARFGESQGFERDKLRDHAWRFRDYVIDSLNADLPYDQFVREQIAGDVKPKPTPASIAATGFLVAGPYDEVGQTQQSEVMRNRVREDEMEDILATVGQTFLGLTVNCARCHDHKFDPITQRDYFRMRSALDGVRAADRPALAAEQIAERKRQARAADTTLAAIERQLGTVESSARILLPPEGIDRPRPLASWTFEDDESEAKRQVRSRLWGNARVANGRLHLDGLGSYLSTDRLPANVAEKTLEAWVVLPNRAQRGGGVISIQSADGFVFDSIVFAERQPGKWMAGSDNFRRTRDLGADAETAPPNALLHVAIAYDREGGITVFRNGEPYGERYLPALGGGRPQRFAEGESQIRIGLRHGSGAGFLAGEVEEARIYQEALTPKQVRASFTAGPDRLKRGDLLRGLSEPDRKEHGRLLSQRQAALQELARAEDLPLVYGVHSAEPKLPARVLLRGDVESPSDEVSAGGLAAITTLKADFGLTPTAPEADRRLALAEWIASPRNPLTARVAVNYAWHHLFGRGIVGSPGDFGFNGERPSHPELLDWLAAEFSGPMRWSRKTLHRLIVTSAAYRQASHSDPKAQLADSESRLLWRFPPRRLSGEEARDAMLAVSGKLNTTVGGPSFRPFQLTVSNSNFYALSESDEPDHRRRSVYRMAVHSAKDPLLETLDCPDPGSRIARRNATTTAVQALEMMNGSFVLRQASGLASRIEAEAGSDAEAQMKAAYSLALGRSPSAAERRRAISTLRQGDAAALAWALLNCSEFLYVR